MDAFFAFASDYWWLAFPLAGVVGSGAAGFSTWWAKQAKLRHKRRLELIKAKSDARSVEISARAQVKAAKIAATGSPDEAERDERRSRGERLTRILTAHDELTKRWLDYELDVAKLIAFPSMSDGRQPLTATFLRAKKTADALRPESAEARIDADSLAEYRDAVHDAEVAFDIAEQDARRVRTSGFTEAERKRLDRAQHLLQVAVDHSATAAERQLAYTRVREELDGLIALSEDAIDVLEHRVAPEVESGTSDR